MSISFYENTKRQLDEIRGKRTRGVLALKSVVVVDLSKSQVRQSFDEGCVNQALSEVTSAFFAELEAQLAAKVEAMKDDALNELDRLRRKIESAG